MTHKILILDSILDYMDQDRFLYIFKMFYGHMLYVKLHKQCVHAATQSNTQFVCAVCVFRCF